MSDYLNYIAPPFLTLATGALALITRWLWSVKKTNEGVDSKLKELNTQMSSLSEKVVLHQAEDTTHFAQVRERTAKLEGGQEVLTQIAAASAVAANVVLKKETS